MEPAYPGRAVIVDLDPVAKRGSAAPHLLMPLAVAVVAVGFGALVLRPAADPDVGDRARERVLSVIPAPTATPRQLEVGRMLGPSILAQRTPRPAPPPLLSLPAEVATAVALGTPDASRAILITVRDASRQLVYKLGDGRMFVLLQTPPDRRRVVLASYGLEEGTVRGQPAQFFMLSVGTLRSIVSWSEGPAGYHLYSATLTIRELIRMAEQLR